MKFNLQPVAPTQDELDTLHQLQTVTDPTERLTPSINGKTYYQLKKDWLMCCYYLGLQEMESHNEHLKNFDEQMLQLQKDYERDVNLVLHNSAQAKGIWLPWVKIAI